MEDATPNDQKESEREIKKREGKRHIHTDKQILMFLFGIFTGAGKKKLVNTAQKNIPRKYKKKMSD